MRRPSQLAPSLLGEDSILVPRRHREPSMASGRAGRGSFGSEGARARSPRADARATRAGSPNARGAAHLGPEQPASQKAGQRGGSVITAHSDRAQKQPRVAPLARWASAAARRRSRPTMRRPRRRPRRREAAPGSQPWRTPRSSRPRPTPRPSTTKYVETPYQHQHS